MSIPQRPKLAPPPVWTSEQLARDRQLAAAQFRQQRLAEPLEAYLDHFEHAQDVMENLIESTVDLTLLRQQALDIFSDPELLDGLRYLAGPPISIDDLKTLADTSSIAAKTLQSDSGLVQRLIDTIREGLDRRRFPWVTEGREPTAQERDAAILATAALIATRRTETGRRTQSKKEQEERVQAALLNMEFEEVRIPGGHIGTIAQAPQPGEFCREVVLGGRKADIVVGLWDRRILPIECKVSNSSTNSVKRLNNDAAVKAVEWRRDFGERQVVPSATLSGVYKLRNLEHAQDRGLTLYWAHRLTDLTAWISQTRP